MHLAQSAGINQPGWPLFHHQSSHRVSNATLVFIHSFALVGKEYLIGLIGFACSSTIIFFGFYSLSRRTVSHFKWRENFMSLLANPQVMLPQPLSRLTCQSAQPHVDPSVLGVASLKDRFSLCVHHRLLSTGVLKTRAPCNNPANR